ncbi:MAG: Ppx/GppA phosphatase family protein [Gammaproteobacteria bacterium]|nr:Ppx/GppA phosphatase family protein [Gammaproteobacteria bacterium]
MITLSDESEPEIIAALDLGSNSFHMVVATNHHGRFKIVDRLREMVRLSAGLNSSRELDKEAMQRAVACLERFGQRLRDMHADSVRAIGTNALRQAKNSRKFLKAAQTALGHPIEVISGIEEARLIYQGTTYAISRPNDRRIVVDIGGGSTEIIVGEGIHPLRMESLFMGCVSMSEQYFPNAKVTRKNFDQAFMSAKLQLRPIVSSYKRIGWDLEVGTSGTIKAISEIASSQLETGNEISLESLFKVRDLLLAKELDLSNVKKERLPVFPGGLAILLAIFDSLDLNQMNFSDGALREGILFDLLGRLRLEHEDVRADTVRGFEHRYHVDFDQANRTELSACMLLNKVKKAWGLTSAEHENQLRWAARLHEVGLDIAHSGYHRHGAYLLQHSDMPGFASSEQQVLACLVGCHRRKIRADVFDLLQSDEGSLVKSLIVLLRLAVLLNRDRVDNEFPIKAITAKKSEIRLAFDKGWIDQSPLTQIDLQQEREYLKAIDIKLSF